MLVRTKFVRDIVVRSAPGGSCVVGILGLRCALTRHRRAAMWQKDRRIGWKVVGAREPFRDDETMWPHANVYASSDGSASRSLRGPGWFAAPGLPACESGPLYPMTSVSVPWLLARRHRRDPAAACAGARCTAGYVGGGSEGARAVRTVRI
jgi:hypothetical protein